MTRQLPWEFATVLDKGDGKVYTSEELIATAGLDWTVGQHPLYSQVFGRPVKVEGKTAIVRETDNTILGITSTSYEPFQNHEVFSFADSLVAEEGARFTAGGQLRGGKQIFAVMELPETIKIGGEDDHKFYIFLRTSHDGSAAISAYITPIRVFCTNTQTAVIRTAVNRWSVRHTKDAREQLKIAVDTLNFAHKYEEEFKKTAEGLLLKKISNERAEIILDDVLPPHIKKRDEAVEEIMDTYLTSKNNEYQETAWGLYNGLTEHYDHMRSGGGKAEAKINSSLIGGGTSSLRNRLMTRLISE